MEGYGYTFPPPFGPMMPREGGDYPDHGDGFGEYYGLRPLDEDLGRPSRSKHRTRKNRGSKRSRSRTRSATKSRSRSRSRTRYKSWSLSKTRSHTRSRSRSRSRSSKRQRELNLKEPGFLDAFRVLYLAPSKHKKNTTKYLATIKRQDRVTEILKSDGLGSKRWLFYPRSVNTENRSDPAVVEVSGSRETCDQRIKIDGDFFIKYKKKKTVDSDAPIAKLKRWELIFYKKLGFIQAV